MKVNVIVVLFIIFNYVICNAQTPNDCDNSITVCGNSNFENLSATGVGNFQELSENNSCSSQENNSLWLTLNINTGGTLGFTLTPVFANSGGNPNTNINIDFDFFIYGPNVTCGNIGQAIRCSTTNPLAANQGNNLTGMNSTETDTSEGPAAAGNSFVRWLNVNAGEVYFLVIDRPIGSSNFKIDWIGTATFNDPPTAGTPSSGETLNLEKCDTDGVQDNSIDFDLSVNTPILLDGQTGVSISYHTSNNDAQTNANKIADPSTFINTSDPQIIHARLTNTTTQCFIVQTFQVDVLDFITSGTPETNIKCDNDNDGKFLFDLTQNDAVIKNGINNSTVSYYLNQSDATSNTNTITDPSSFTNSNNPQTIWARLDSNTSDCFGTTSFQIQVNDSPLTTDTSLVLCDDDTDGFANFNLTEANPQISSNHINETFTYFETLADAQTATNSITNPSNYSNQTANSDTVFARITNANNCVNTAQIDLTVHALPIVNSPVVLALCDDDTDGFTNFNLTEANPQISSNHINETFTYFETLADAQTATNSITNPSNYSNQTANSDTVFARITNANNCVNTAQIDLNVHALPIVNSPVVLALCDDDTDGFTNFNLTEANPQISSNHINETFTYFETLADAQTATNSITNPSNYSNQTANSDTVFARITNANNCVNTAQIDLTVHALPIVNSPVVLALCDDDTDGFTNFNLTEANPQISSNHINETFTYFETLADAQTATNSITNPSNYSNQTANNDTVFARITNANNCVNTAQINLTVHALPIVNSPVVLALCDDDTDGFINFNLTEANPQISSNHINETFTYFETLADAQTASNSITNPSNYSNQTANNDTVFARITNANNCVNTAQIDLTVHALPIVNSPVVLALCDDDTDGFTNFNLTEANPQISSNHINETFTYFETLADAQTATNSITNPSNYSNQTANNDTVFARITNANNCVNTAQIDLTVNPLPVLNIITLKQCDDDTDGFSNFNLTEANAQISSNHANETFTFYKDSAYTNQISASAAITYQNTIPTNDTVYVRVINNTTSCSNDISLNLLVTTTQIPSTFNRTFRVCDDFLDINGNDNANNNDTDGIASFNFESVRNEIQTLFPVQNVTVSFYRNQADALSEQNEITDATNYRNIGYPNTQDIYVRVDNDLDNGCLGLGSYIQVIVDPVPTANSINATNELEECDDLIDGDATNGVAQFDLEELTPIILGNQSTMAYTVTYHHSSNDAATGDNPIDTITPYRNHTSPFRQTIFVRVQGNGCYFDRYTFDLVVNPTPTANAINTTNTLEVCDNDDDGSATNGFVQDLDLEMLTEVILGNNQNNNDFTLTYHTTFALAQSGNTPITGPYTNDSNPDRIFVRIVNNNTQCVNTTYNFDIQVNPEPLDNPDGLVSNLSECDNTTDGDDTNGFIQTFDLESQIPDILGDPNLQDEDDFEVTFHLTQADATAGDNPQSTPFTNTLRNRQTIFVRIENKATGCVNDDLTFDAIVNPLPDFQVTTPQTVCLNNTPLTLRVENPNTIYTYQWQDDNGNSLGTDISQEVATGGQYTVTATTTDGTLCQRSKTITVKESNIATITDDDITIVDDSQNNSITINNNTNNLGEGDYEFALQSENGVLVRDYQDHNVFEGLEGGIYTIFVRDKNGCGVVTFTVPIVEFPKFFTPNGDGIKDTWKIKGATLRFFPESSIQIFNRQGKVIASMRIDSPGWNGTYLNNTPLPSNDYWYRIQLIDTQGNIRHRKGHFSLIRR